MTTYKNTQLFVVLVDRLSPLGDAETAWLKGDELKRNDHLKEFTDERISTNIKVGNIAPKEEVASNG